MTDTTQPSRDYLSDFLPQVLTEWATDGVDEAAERLEDDDNRDGITRYISSITCDDTGRVAVKTYAGDLFFFLITIKEL